MQRESVVRWSPRLAVPVDLTPLHVPFSLEVHRPTGSDAAPQDTSAELRLRLEAPARLRLLWRVPFHQLGRLLAAVSAGDMLLFQGQCQSFSGGEHTTVATYEGSEPLDVPRVQHYPLVAVVEVQDAPRSPSQVVALVAVVHLRGAHAPMATCVLHRYVRQADGRVTLLQEMYGSGAEDCGAGGPADQAADGGGLGECVVCLSEPAARVLLPCRHGCVCDSCFGRLSCCPLCRGHIAQYFSVPTAQPAPPPSTSVPSGVPPSVARLRPDGEERPANPSV